MIESAEGRKRKLEDIAGGPEQLQLSEKKAKIDEEVESEDDSLPEFGAGAAKAKKPPLNGLAHIQNNEALNPAVADIYPFSRVDEAIKASLQPKFGKVLLCPRSGSTGQD